MGTELLRIKRRGASEKMAMAAPSKSVESTARPGKHSLKDVPIPSMSKSEKNKRKNELRAKRRRERQQAGLCIECGKRPAENGQLCPPCRKIHRKSGHNQYLKNKAILFDLPDGQHAVLSLEKITRLEREQAGLCTKCGKRPAKHGKTCAPCREKNRAYGRNRNRIKQGIPLDLPVRYLSKISSREKKRRADAGRQNWKHNCLQAGLCIWCGKLPTAEESHLYCPGCLEKARLSQRKRSRIKRGLPLDFPYRQRSALSLQKKQMLKREQAGLCTECGKRPAEHGNRCATCENCRRCALRNRARIILESSNA
jgi:hypothetical protein